MSLALNGCGTEYVTPKKTDTITNAFAEVDDTQYFDSSKLGIFKGGNHQTNNLIYQNMHSLKHRTPPNITDRTILLLRFTPNK
jgi:hypothetical protein